MFALYLASNERILRCPFLAASKNGVQPNLSPFSRSYFVFSKSHWAMSKYPKADAKWRGFIRSNPWATTGEIPLNLSKNLTVSKSPLRRLEWRGPIFRHDLSLTHEGMVQIKYSTIWCHFARDAIIKGVLDLSSNSQTGTQSWDLRYSIVSAFWLTAA